MEFPAQAFAIETSSLEMNQLSERCGVYRQGGNIKS